MSKYLWVLWVIILISLGTLNVLSLDERHTLKEVIRMGDVQIAEDQLWVEVSLEKNAHEVVVRKGEQMMRTMPCSGGTEDEPTVMGVFYLQNRGEWFYSEKYDEGAHYWVRFYDQYLFHSVPVDEHSNVIQKEKEKIGKAASHGCVRLLHEDAKWFYDNVPDDTMVIIHD